MEKGGDGIDKLIRMWFDTVIDSCVNFIGMTIILATFDPLVALGTVFFMLTYALLSIPLTRRGGEASNATNQMEEDVAGLSFEIISNVRSVKVLGMGQGLLTIVKGKFGEWFQKIRTRVRLFRVRAAALNLWAQTFRVGISAFIVWGIVQGRYEVGFLILFYSYFGYVWISLERLSDITLDFVVSRYNLLRMKQILDVPAGIDREDGKCAFPQDWQRITMEGVSFSYGDKDVLHDVSLTVRRGERIGIVGISGAGKSTLFKLFLKEHEHYSGTISIDDVLLKDISRSSFFGAAAVVLQDTEVFNFTLRENIIMANPDRAGDEDLLHRALEVAHITDFLPRLPDGLETVIGEKGIKLSGGEKQRVGIARAIFKDPQMLFLDEATSHLDLESEEKIRDSLHQFFQSVTAVVIAHRLTTIREMDRIIVIEDGRIIEEGSFELLRAKKGRFNELWEMQKL
jgi:ATP-binding cassette subfamily B protein